MDRAKHRAGEPVSADVLDFDAAFLAACPPDVQEDLMAEAALLADAFAPEGPAGELRAMARTLSTGARDEEMDRTRAHQLAAALRRLARMIGN
jgi:hypothetical protein